MRRFRGRNEPKRNRDLDSMTRDPACDRASYHHDGSGTNYRGVSCAYITQALSITDRMPSRPP